MPHLNVHLVQRRKLPIAITQQDKQEANQNGKNYAAAKDWRGGAADYLTPPNPQLPDDNAGDIRGE